MSQSKKQPKAVFRADASQKIGGGHIMRCLTLANALGLDGWQSYFAVREGTREIVPVLETSGHALIVVRANAVEEVNEIAGIVSDADLLIVDHYGRDSVFERAGRRFARRIMVIDDLADRQHNCDILLDQTYGRRHEAYTTLVPKDARILTGTNYALLRPEFAVRRNQALARRTIAGPIECVLVSFGASDPHGITPRVVEGLLKLNDSWQLNVVTGGAGTNSIGTKGLSEQYPPNVKFHGFNADMSQLMADADLAVGAAGSTAWERCCLGLPTIMIVTASNQQLIAEQLQNAGAAIYAGDAENFDALQFDQIIQDILERSEARHDMAIAASEIVDGRGTERVVDVIIHE